MGSSDDLYQKFANLTFDDFRKMAGDESLSKYEKIGFPDSYRKDTEELILKSIAANLPQLKATGKVVLDVGPGCSGLPHMLIDLCRKQGHRLLLVDSAEMLAHLPDDNFIHKFAARFPQWDALTAQYRSKVDVLLVYSVLHHVFAEANVWEFLDASLDLLAEGGEMLVGDVPNISKRQRFFSSANGIKFHQQFMGTQSLPNLQPDHRAQRQIGDSVILALISRARKRGFDAYVLPQAPGLPFENRREDLLIRRP